MKIKKPNELCNHMIISPKFLLNISRFPKHGYLLRTLDHTLIIHYGDNKNYYDHRIYICKYLYVIYMAIITGHWSSVFCRLQMYDVCLWYLYYLCPKSIHFHD